MTAIRKKLLYKHFIFRVLQIRPQIYVLLMIDLVLILYIFFGISSK